MPTSHRSTVDLIASECLLTRWRMLNRVLTGIYDEQLRSFGLKSSQLGLLVAVAKMGPVRRIDLGRRQHLDPSTLTRNLQVMLKQRWIEEVPDAQDQRGALLKITRVGEALLKSIGPAWKRAQAQASRMIGSDGATFLRTLERAAQSEPSG